MSWESFWKFVLFLTLAGYGILVIVVAIGGFKNVLDMLKELSQPVDRPEEDH